MTRDELVEFFEVTTKKMVEICKAKNFDYAGTTGEEDCFSNFTRVEKLGICRTEQGFLTRMTDELCRVTTFAQNGVLAVKDETVEDTLIDLANYSLLMAAYIKSKRREYGSSVGNEQRARGMGSAWSRGYPEEGRGNQERSEVDAQS